MLAVLSVLQVEAQHGVGRAVRWRTPFVRMACAFGGQTAAGWGGGEGEGGVGVGVSGATLKFLFELVGRMVSALWTG